jgi:hypothetical protein
VPRMQRKRKNDFKSMSIESIDLLSGQKVKSVGDVLMDRNKEEVGYLNIPALGVRIYPDGREEKLNDQKTPQVDFEI